MRNQSPKCIVNELEFLMVVDDKTEILFDIVMDSSMDTIKKYMVLSIYYSYSIKQTMEHIYYVYIQQNYNWFYQKILKWYVYTFIF